MNSMDIFADFSNISLATAFLDEALEMINSATDPHAHEYVEALDLLKKGVLGGYLDYAGALGEQLALEGPHFDAAMAYRCYYIVAKLECDSVVLNSLSSSPNHYCGPPGDFRNEGMVDGLIQALGVAALPRPTQGRIPQRYPQQILGRQRAGPRFRAARYVQAGLFEPVLKNRAGRAQRCNAAGEVAGYAPGQIRNVAGMERSHRRAAVGPTAGH